MNSASEVLQQIAALTGRKPAGKQRIGMQGIENAITGQKLFMPSDEFAAYLRSGAAYVETLRPVGHLEEQLVQKIIDGNWWLNRSYALENNLLNARRLENSAHSDRSTDERTEAMMAQALGYGNECGGSNTFDVLSKCATRVSQLYAEATRQLNAMQFHRIAAGGNSFVLTECRAHTWYMEQIRAAQQLPVSAPASVNQPAMSTAERNAAVAEVLKFAESNDLVDPEDVAVLKRFRAG